MAGGVPVFGIGSVVVSTAGRDKGGWFAVVSLEGEFAFLADGKARKLVNPKKKKRKHLQETNMSVCLEEITSDRKLRKQLTALGSRPLS